MSYALQSEVPLPHSGSGILKSHLININWIFFACPLCLTQNHVMYDSNFYLHVKRKTTGF